MGQWKRTQNEQYKVDTTNDTTPIANLKNALDISKKSELIRLIVPYQQRNCHSFSKTLEKLQKSIVPLSMGKNAGFLREVTVNNVSSEMILDSYFTIFLCLLCSFLYYIYV